MADNALNTWAVASKQLPLKTVLLTLAQAMPSEHNGSDTTVATKCDGTHCPIPGNGDALNCKSSEQASDAECVAELLVSSLATPGAHSMNTTTDSSESHWGTPKHISTPLTTRNRHSLATSSDEMRGNNSRGKEVAESCLGTTATTLSSSSEFSKTLHCAPVLLSQTCPTPLAHRTPPAHCSTPSSPQGNVPSLPEQEVPKNLSGNDPGSFLSVFENLVRWNTQLPSTKYSRPAYPQRIPAPHAALLRNPAAEVGGRNSRRFRKPVVIFDWFGSDIALYHPVLPSPALRNSCDDLFVDALDTYHPLFSYGASVHYDHAVNAYAVQHPYYCAPDGGLASTYWGMWEDERDRMVYVSWLPRVARAADRMQKKRCEVELKYFISYVLGFGGVAKVLLFPPDSAHCKVLFISEPAARTFLDTFGGSSDKDYGPKLWKALICDYFNVQMKTGIHGIRAKVIWADQTKMIYEERYASVDEHQT